MGRGHWVYTDPNTGRTQKFGKHTNPAQAQAHMDQLYRREAGNYPGGSGIETISLPSLPAPKPSKQQVASWDWLLKLLKKQVPNIPAMEIPGMTANEQTAQGILTDLLAGKHDPRTSPLYAGLREEAAATKEQGLTALRRRANLGGNFYSTPALRAEGEYSANVDRGLNTLLGGMYESTMSPQALLSASAQYGALPREIEQQQAAADYQARLSNLLAPYQMQAPIAGMLSGLQYLPQDEPQTYVRDWAMAPRPQSSGGAGFGDIAKGLAQIYMVSRLPGVKLF